MKMGSPKYHSSSVFNSRAFDNREAKKDIRKEGHHPYYFFTYLPLSSSVTRTHIHLLCLIILLFLLLLFTVVSYSDSRPLVGYLSTTEAIRQNTYLYWGYRVDCPGKLCDKCAGLGHQESSLRCALEEAMVLHRTFVMPSSMCISQQHNDKSLLHTSSKAETFESWGAESCSMDSLYDLGLISETVRVILDTSSEWQQVLSKVDTSRTVVNVKGVSRAELLLNPYYREAMAINRSASELSWFVECKDRKNHSALLLPYSFLPGRASEPLRLAAEKIKRLLGEYDAIHVRRGDKLKIRKDRFGVNRTLLPHLDRDTQPHAIMMRIANWIPEGHTLFIASNERTPGFFDPLTSKYKVVFSSHFRNILDPIVHNNYQLFIVERLILLGAKVFFKTFKEDPSDLSLTDDTKKKIRAWEIPVFTFDESPHSL